MDCPGHRDPCVAMRAARFSPLTQNGAMLESVPSFVIFPGPQPL
jgi:hypothetical protein